jgi:hypothetical protein
MELSCSWQILPEDLKLLDCFAVFAAVSLEKSELQDFAKYGVVEKALKKYIADRERNSSRIPARLVIPAAEAASIFRVNFDVPAWDGIGFFKIVWAMFSRFNLLEEFRISNECFFTFISSMSSTYNKVPYHNWRHAVDVTQFDISINIEIEINVNINLACNVTSKNDININIDINITITVNHQIDIDINRLFLLIIILILILMVILIMLLIILLIIMIFLIFVLTLRGI